MNKKVLLADDSITIQKVVDIIFATENYELATTDDGDKALEKAIQEQPDIVIADISMPGKDGFELCRDIKSDPALKKTAVLLLPGAFDHFDEQKAHEVCADGWLTKPFESQALLDKVAQLLEAEPLRLFPEEAEEGSAEGVSGPAAAAELPPEEDAVTDSTLGLDQVDGLAPEDSKESAEDIWDAVSFAEEDLEPQEAADEEDDAFTGASGAAVKSVSDAQEIEEPGLEASSVMEPEPGSETAAVGELEETGPDGDGHLNVSTEDQTDNEPEFKEQSRDPLEQTSASAVTLEEESDDESEEDVDFSRFSDEDSAETVSATADNDQPGPTFEPESTANSGLESAEEETADFVASEGFEQFNGGQDRDITGSAEEQSSAEAASGELDDSGESSAAEEFQPGDLYAASVAAADAMISDPADESDSAAVEEDIVELNEADIVDDEADTFGIAGKLDQQREEAMTEADSAVSGDESASGVEGAAAEAEGAEGEDEDEFVFADEAPLADAVTADTGFAGEEQEADVAADSAALEEEPVAAEAGGAEEEDEDEFVFADEAPLADVVTADTGFAGEEQEADVAADSAALEEEPVAAEAGGAEEEDEDEFVFADEAPLADEVTAGSGTAAEDPLAEEEDFNFALPAEDVSAPLDQASSHAPVSVQTEAQIEQQLRELSEEELQELVAKVAGPLIEKMAGEMLEQIAWEVVPDLAEAMIKEEIRKVKEAVR